jgi:hypothetical protein
LLETLKGREHLEELGVNGKDDDRMDLREIRLEVVEWMQLAQEWDQWLGLVNGFIKMRRIY